MKKLAIAGASVVLAALPVAGAFADYSGSASGTAADTIQLTIEQSCTFAAGTRTAAINLGTLAAGNEFTEQSSPAMTISCNDSNGWTLKATATALRNPTSSATDEDATYTIPFGAYPASITADSTASVWSAKIAVDETNASKVTMTSGWGTYGGSTANSTTILESKTFGGTGANASDVQPVSNMTVTPSYKAYAATTQQAGSYQGTMTYNFATSES